LETLWLGTTEYFNTSEIQFHRKVTELLYRKVERHLIQGI